MLFRITLILNNGKEEGRKMSVLSAKLIEWLKKYHLTAWQVMFVCETISELLNKHINDLKIE